MMHNVWYLHRRAVLIIAALLCGLLTLLLLTGVIVHFAAPPGPASHQGTAEQGQLASPGRGQQTAAADGDSATQQPAGSANDVARWNAMPAIAPAVSATMPAINATDRSDPAAFAKAFATQLFTRDYRTQSRTALLSWVQAQNAPLQSPNYPAQDWTKVLADSLTDLSWDNAAQTPVPASGTWALLASEGARDTVSAVSVRTDPQWESTVAGGYQLKDPLTTVQDVMLRVTRRTGTGTKAQTSGYDVSIAVQTGTSPLSGYGAAATNNFVSQAVS